MAGQAEQKFEKVLFASRWLLAPMYFGLVIALLMLVYVFGHELFNYVMQIQKMNADKVILVVLTLIDLTLAGNLLLIVLFSGYESFVSRIDVAEAEERLGWMGTVDFSGLKMKLIASIVAISAIYLLKRFMEIGKSGEAVPVEELKWMVIIHVIFIISGVLMAAMDWMTAQAKSKLKGKY